MTEHALLTELKEGATAIEECPTENAEVRDSGAQRAEQGPVRERTPLSSEGKQSGASEQDVSESGAGNFPQMNFQVKAAAGDDEVRRDFSLRTVVEQAECQAIRFALARTNNNRAQAARLLRISRALLYKRMHRYHLL